MDVTVEPTKEMIIGSKHYCNRIVDPAECCPLSHNSSLPTEQCKCPEWWDYKKWWDEQNFPQSFLDKVNKL